MLYCIGLNHKTAPVNIRERLAFGPDIIVAALRALSQQDFISETVIISTCNRTEILCIVNDQIATDKIKNQLIQWLSDFHSLDKKELKPYLYQHINEKMVEHLLSVASGLDSLILGEPQILGQVKKSYKIALDAKFTGKLLDRLFQHTFSVAKQVRTDTAIGHNPISIAYAAVNLSRQIFTEIGNKTALLIGAGETVELAARYLKQHGIGHLIIANRTIENAQKLAKSLDAVAITLPEINQHLFQADIVISSTASPLPILGKGAVESALKKRKRQPIFMVDIAVPRDIESEVADLDDIYLYTVDDLEEIITENQKSRAEAAKQAEKIVQFQAYEFMNWIASLNAVSIITDYRQNAEKIRDEVLANALKRLKNNKDPEETLKFLAKTLTNKLLHTPSNQLREASAKGNNHILKAAKQLLQAK